MPYDIEDGGGELAITPPYVQHPLSTKGKEPETYMRSEMVEKLKQILANSTQEEFDKDWAALEQFNTEDIEPISGWQSYPPDSQVQINNIVDEVRGDIPRLTQAEILLRRCEKHVERIIHLGFIQTGLEPLDLSMDIKEYFNEL